jgi:DNA processing protein
MDVLQSFLQLTLYGINLSEKERERLFHDPPSKWAELLNRIENQKTLAKLEDVNWCRSHWENLDRWTRSYDLKWTYPGRSDFPPRLAQTSRPPLILCYRGEPVWLEHEMISVVGSRDPMADSLNWMRRHLLEFLLKVNVTIASGGARGVDARAHELTLLADRPPICFLPSGILKPYPQAHEPLFHRILDAGGVLISGFAPDAFMQKSYFHARNRWIAGISLVTVIIEAQRKSGSYLTAKLALEEGRAIATLPVSPMSVRGHGNLDLIYSGAQMLRDDQDLAAFVGQELAHFAQLRSADFPSTDCNP